MRQWSEEDNPLKDTFLIKVKDAREIAKIAKSIEKLDGVALVQYGAGIIDKFLSIFKGY